MSLTVQAQSLPILPRQSITAPIHTKVLAADIDPRHNNCLLWTLANDEKGDEKPKKESIEVIMLRLGEALEPVNAKYVGNFKNNAGAVHVFILRESDRLFSLPSK